MIYKKLITILCILLFLGNISFSQNNDILKPQANFYAFIKDTKYIPQIIWDDLKTNTKDNFKIRPPLKPRKWNAKILDKKKNGRKTKRNLIFIGVERDSLNKDAYNWLIIYQKGFEKVIWLYYKLQYDHNLSDKFFLLHSPTAIIGKTFYKFPYENYLIEGFNLLLENSRINIRTNMYLRRKPS